MKSELNQHREQVAAAKAANEWKADEASPVFVRPGDKEKVVQVAPNGVRRVVSETGRVIRYLQPSAV